MAAMKINWLTHKGEVILVWSEPVNRLTFSPEQALNLANGLLATVRDLRPTDTEFPVEDTEGSDGT